MSLVERALDKLRRDGQPETIATLSMPAPPRDALTGEFPTLTGRKIFIDRSALRASGYLPDSNQDRRFADEYRHIKRPLIAAATSVVDPGRDNPHLIMMASALPGDGKTFTSINLALSMARERDISVVLVDADVAKPHVSRIFGVEHEPGLLDALVDPAIDLQSLILPTDVRGLAILPAGQAREGATELLASDRMAHLANQIVANNPHCLALFDSSPLLVTSESSALAAHMGQVVLVVRSGKTPRQAVLDALQMLGSESSVGLVLNQGRRNLVEGLYGYGYGDYGNDSNVTS